MYRNYLLRIVTNNYDYDNFFVIPLLFRIQFETSCLFPLKLFHAMNLSLNRCNILRLFSSRLLKMSLLASERASCQPAFFSLTFFWTVLKWKTVSAVESDGSNHMPLDWYKGAERERLVGLHAVVKRKVSCHSLEGSVRPCVSVCGVGWTCLKTDRLPCSWDGAFTRMDAVSKQNSSFCRPLCIRECARVCVCVFVCVSRERSTVRVNGWVWFVCWWGTRNLPVRL